MSLMTVTRSAAPAGAPLARGDGVPALTAPELGGLVTVRGGQCDPFSSSQAFAGGASRGLGQATSSGLACRRSGPSPHRRERSCNEPDRALSGNSARPPAQG
jgi:hypothetical protein